jgi:histone H2B
MDKLTKEIYQRIASEAGKLTRHSSKVTLSEREVQTACKLVFPLDFQQYLIPRVVLAVQTYKEK